MLAIPSRRWLGFLFRKSDGGFFWIWLCHPGPFRWGRYDFAKPVPEAVGAELVFHKVTQKPGKPLLFAGR